MGEGESVGESVAGSEDGEKGWRLVHGPPCSGVQVKVRH